MPRQNAIAVQSSFVKGLITEATALTFPENAATDTDNCIYTLTGLVTRRPGFNFEDQYATYATNTSGVAYVTYLWKSAGGRGDISFVVTQVGNNLHFYKAGSDTALSKGKHVTVIDLTTYLPVGVSTATSIECQFSAGNGDLFVTNPNLDTFYVEYDADTDALTANAINIQARDFEGDTADALAVDARPATNYAGLTAAHLYNLQNQGWTTANLNAWDTARSDMPSNCDVAWYYKNTSNAFDYTIVDQFFTGNSKAPKGHYIYNIYNYDRSDNVSGATDLAIPSDRVSTSAFYAGRVFYSSLNNAGQGSKIFFSQIIERKEEYGFCFQTNDPTSEQLFDLLPSDGGVININEAGTILKMIPALNSLLVFASNGIWAITGSQGTGFSANDYAVNKISSITNISHGSFVDVEGVPFWWNLEGIYTVEVNPQSNSIRVVSISRSTVDTYYNTIPVKSKQFAKGCYDPLEKTIKWIFSSVDPSRFSDNYLYDSVLTFNTLTQAFYPWTVATDNVKIVSIVDVIGLGGAYEQETVQDSGVDVVDSGDTVITFLAANTGISSTVKYLVAYTQGGTDYITFAECWDGNNVDWFDYDTVGEDFASYFVTGYAVRGQGVTRFQHNYLQLYSASAVNSSFKVKGQWNFSISPNSGKWSTQQICSIVADGNYSYKTNRLKIRGRGLACQFRIENNGTDPFNLVGWSAMEAINQWP